MIADWTTVGFGNAAWIEIIMTAVSASLLVVSVLTANRATIDMHIVVDGSYNGALRAIARNALVRCYCRTMIQVGFLINSINALTNGYLKTGDAGTHRTINWISLLMIQAFIAVTVLYDVRQRGYIISELVRAEDFFAHMQEERP